MTAVIFVLFRFRGASGVAKKGICIDAAHFLGKYKDFRLRCALGVARKFNCIDSAHFLGKY